MSIARGVAQTTPHGLDDLSAGRKHTHCRQRAGVDNDTSVKENLELAEAADDLFDVHIELASQTCRHTDGMQPRDSEATIYDGDSGHATSLFGVARSRRNAVKTSARGVPLEGGANACDVQCTDYH